MAPLSAMLTVQTDADVSPHAISLVVEPSGAVLAFDTSATAGFGNFGQVVLLESATQSFSVTNTGSAAATVTLATGRGSPFTVSNATFSIPAAARRPTLRRLLRSPRMARAGASG